MLGFVKIVKACEQATEDGYAHIWVDTCEPRSYVLFEVWRSQLLIAMWQAALTKLLLLS
jgi:hypothetical protein